MQLPDGKLSAEDQEKVLNWLKKYPQAENMICPVCGESDWWIGEHLVQPVTLGAGLGITLGGIGYPQVMIVSNPCGYTMFINAVIAGIVPGNPIETKKD